MAARTYDIIVIGGGPIGLAAAWYAANESRRVLVLERFDFFNDRGASAGESRQFRIQYNEKEISQLVLDSMPLWDELQSYTEEELMRTAGCLWFGNPHVTGAEGQIESVINVMRELGLPYDLLDRAGIEANCHFQNLPSSYIGFFQKDGAAINYPATLRVLYRKAQESGLVTLMPHQRVVAIESGRSGVLVKTESGSFCGGKLIIAAGPYVNEVLGLLDLRLDIAIWEMVSAWFKCTAPALDFPTWISFDGPRQEDPMLYYGFPELDWARPGYVKVAANYPVKIHTDVSSYTRQPDPKVVTNIGNWVESFMKGLDPEPHFPSTCICAIVPEPGNPHALRKEMILDFVPESVPHHRNIVLSATGWAAKMAPLIGKICVDLAVHGSTPHDIGKLRLTAGVLQ